MSNTYLITGGCGFIGSHVIDEILATDKDALIVNVDKLGIGSNTNNVVKDPRIINLYFDIQDNDIYDIFYKYSPKYVIHLAAESHVDRSISSPASFIDSNIKSTTNIVECIRTIKTDTRLVHVSTDEVYGHLQEKDSPFNEQSPLAPRSPYAASKASSDLIVLSYKETYGINAIITRCCNNYGPRQYTEKFIPTILNSIKHDVKIPVYGNGQNKREWIFVRDHAKALLRALHFEDRNRNILNIFGTACITNLQMIEEIISSVKLFAPHYSRYIHFKDYITFVEDRKGHDLRYELEKHHDLGDDLFNQMSLQEGLSKTILSYLDS